MTFDKKELSILEKELDRQYVALLEEVRDELANSEDRQYVELIGRAPADSGEASMGDVLADINANMFERHIRKIRSIEAATTRIRENVYGICTECEEDIPFERLKAYPTARRCVPCQERHDRTYAYQATPSI
jgi:RNA polymerase-binding protein DksA